MCEHKSGIVINGTETRCAECHAVTGRYIGNPQANAVTEAMKEREREAYPILRLDGIEEMSATAGAIINKMMADLLTAQGNGGDMKIKIGVRDGEALRKAFAAILPPWTTVDEAIAAMGYVPKVDTLEQLASQTRMLLGDELQTVRDEKKDLEVENSRLRRKLERLERKR